MKRDLRTLALGIIIGAAVGMGVGPTLAMAYSGNPSEDSARALQDIASTLKSQDSSRAIQDNTRAIQEISRAIQSIDSTLRNQRR